MKRELILIFIILPFVVSFRCEYNDKPWEDFEYEFYHEENFRDHCEVLCWPQKNIKHVDSPKAKVPKETYDSKEGDCYDIVLLVGYLCREIGYDVKVVLLFGIRKGEITEHSIIMIDGLFYQIMTIKEEVYEEVECSCSPYDWEADGWELVEIISFDKALWSAYTSGKIKTHDTKLSCNNNEGDNN